MMQNWPGCILISGVFSKSTTRFLSSIAEELVGMSGDPMFTPRGNE